MELAFDLDLDLDVDFVEWEWDGLSKPRYFLRAREGRALELDPTESARFKIPEDVELEGG